MFVKQSHSSMPPSLWLHVDGVSVPADVHSFQSPVRTYDYQTKHLQSPAESPTSANFSYGFTATDGAYYQNNASKQQRLLENVDMPKKVFKDRQIKKVKSLPGLIKGTALSRSTPSQASSMPSPAPSAISVNTLPDDQLPMVAFENDDDALTAPQAIEPQNETRRPRVNFAPKHKIQFIGENDELSQQQHHVPINDEPLHSRTTRLSRKTSNSSNAHTHTTPSIQRSPHRQNFTCPTSRVPCPQTTSEPSTARKYALSTARTPAAHITNLPDIVSQTLSSEHPTHEKYILQREKPVSRSNKPSIAVSNHLAFEMAPDNMYTTNIRFSPIPDSSIGSQKSDSGDSEPGQLQAGHASMSSSTTNSRQRAAFRTISLRQQFVSPNKSKPAEAPSLASTHHQQQQHATKPAPNTHRSSSLKISSTRIFDNAEEQRTTASNEPNKQSKRSYIVHYSPKKPLGGSTHSYPHEATRSSHRSHSSDPSEEMLQNMLTVVRAPYSSNTGVAGGTTTAAEDNRTARNPSMRVPLEFNMTSNTITV